MRDQPQLAAARTPQRLPGIDALRGLAVLLMVIQHVVIWVSADARSSWMIQLSGALGGMAAPLFVTLSGLGATLITQRRAHADRRFMRRGVVIIGFGYLMNALTPHWFSFGSWYVLHMIGAALLLAPLLSRVPDRALIMLLLLTVAAAGLLQSRMDTPLRMYNQHMAAPVGPAGVLRYALIGGFFPIFPWLAFFMAGLLAGRWLLDGRSRSILMMGIVLPGIALGLSTIGWSGVEFTLKDPWVRFFKFQPTFYAALAPITFLLIGLSLLFLVGFSALQRNHFWKPSDILVCLGRTSLTILIVHVAVIRESASAFGFWKRLPASGTLLAVAAILAVFTLSAKAWRRIDYKYGFEWLLRRIDR